MIVLAHGEPGCCIFLWDTAQKNAGKPRQFTFSTGGRVRTVLPRTLARAPSHLTPFHRGHSEPVPSVITLEEKLGDCVYKSYAITAERLWGLTEKFVPGLSDLSWNDWKDSLTSLYIRTRRTGAALGPSDGYRFYADLTYVRKSLEGSGIPFQVYD